MKKFLTFFAMMFALLGFSIPASAADYTVYVDVSGKGWSDCYLKTHYSDKDDEGWHIPTATKTSLGGGLYKFVFSYDGLKDVIISKNNNADSRGNEGTENVGWFAPSKSGNWYFGTGKLYTLSSGTDNSATVTDYKESTPPYIYIDGASHAFTEEGSNWVYTIDAGSAEKSFRIQNIAGDNPGDGHIFYGPNTTLKNTTSTESIWLYDNGGGFFKAPAGYTYKLSFNKSSYAAVTSSSNEVKWTVTPTEAKPATPVLPASATGNKIVIPAVSGGATVYYTETATGDPSVDSWTAYPADGIALQKGYTTIRAAAYKEGLGWSDVAAAKTYTYNLPEVNITIDLHTGKATLTPLVALNTLPAGANAVILYSCGPDAPNKVYTPGTPVDMEAECSVDGKTRYPIKALVRAWGNGDGSVAVANQSVDSDVRSAQWIGPAEVRRICLWSYNTSGNPVYRGEFTRQDDGSYVISYSPVLGTSDADASQHYFIRVVMNHDEPNNMASDAGGTFYSLGNANEAVSVASGTEYNSFNRFTPSASDTRGMFFAGADRDAVKLTLKGNLDEYTLDGSADKCKRFVPSSIVPEWNPEANIKSVELRDANGKVLCTLTQALGTGEENYWVGITTEALKKANDSDRDTRFCFVADTKDGTKYYSIGQEYNYWVQYGRYDSTTSHKPSTSNSVGNYFCVNENSAIAEVAISFDGTTASRISISPYTDTKQMNISGTPNAPAIIGYGSEVGSWDNSREFNRSATLGGWVYTFTATQSTGEYLIYGSKGNLYAPIGLQLGSPSTNVWRQVPSNLDANAKARYAAKMPGLQIGARYRMLLKEEAGEVQISIEALPESVKKIKSVELVKEDGTTELTLDAEGAPGATEISYSGYPLSWQGSGVSDKYRIKVTMGYDDDPGVTVSYVAWAKNDNYYLQSATQQNNKPYNHRGSEQAGYFRIQPNGEYYVQVILSTTDGQASWLAVGTEHQDADDPTPYVNRVAWSLSDDNILKPGDTKYFYMSPTQNDNRLSPEWELVKDEATGKYVLDDFVVIPNAQFIVRGVSKAESGTLTVQDWGWSDDGLCQIYASQFGITDGGTIAADAKLENQYELKHISTPGRGYAWNLGASMVRLEFDPSVTGAANLKVSVDFSYPSTLAGAPKPGFPWVGLTSSNIVARVGRGQSYDFASNLGTLDNGVPNMGISSNVLTTIGMDSETVNSAFTNAFIQWTPDGDKVYVYDKNVSGTDADGKNIYYITSGGNLKTTVVPGAGQVMSSTILPPRVAPQFKQYTSQGITSPSASSLTFKYHGVEKHKFSHNGNETKEIEFAVYTISNVELQGLYKVFTGYGARRYGNDINGLTYFPNWGVSVGAGYDNEPITESRTMPMNGGGQILYKNGDNVVAQGGYTDTFVSGWAPEGSYDASHDNTAGKYFRFDNRRYVATMTFYLALGDDTNGSVKFHNSMDGQLAGTYNDGRNFSWIQFDLAAERPVITLNKRDANTARARWSINRDHNEGRPQIVSYKTELLRVDPDKWEYPGSGNEPVIVDGSILQSAVRGASYTTPDNPTWIDPEIRDMSGLGDGTYVARIYDVVYLTEEGYNVKGSDHWNYSEPVTFFSVKSGVIRGEQRVPLSKDGHKIYYPIVRVYPDIANTFKSLPSGYDRSKITAKVTVSNIGPDTHFQDASGNALPVSTSLDVVPVEKQAYVVFTTPYKSAANNGGKEQEGVAVVVYPEGYLGATRENLQNFDVCDSHINELTGLKLEVRVPDADSHAEAATAEAMTYMPAGRLAGRLEAAGLKEGRTFNYLVVSTPEDLISAGVNDGYARIYYADKNNSDQICYIGNVEHTKVHAQVYYVSKDADGNEVETPLFDEDALLDMKANPDDNNDDKVKVYTTKRLKIGGIPYVTESDAGNEMATDINGKELKLRQTQTATFRVELTYTPDNEEAAADADRWKPFVSRKLPTSLTYDEKNLTSPRQGLRDVLTQADADARQTDETVAKDVTAVSERYVENYGGLFTNIEDAHVALHAVERNKALVGSNSLRKWYMDHGDKWIGTEDLNPFNPGNHLAIGNAKNGGAETYAAPEEVHPLLRGTKVESTAGFRNDSKLNNAWWNHNASRAPEFHEADQINGKLTIEGGKVTGFVPANGSAHPKDHRTYWAGVKPANSEKYRVWDGGYVIKAPQGFDVDIRDPQHGYYGMSNHFSTKRSGFYLGEMPLDLNDIVAVLGRGNGVGSDSFEPDSRTDLYNDAQAVYDKAKALNIHGYSEAINDAVADGAKEVTVGNNTYPINWNMDYIWDYDPIYDVRERAAFEPQTEGGKSPAEELFETAGHMFFKVRHVNHESWFVPGANVAEGALKTQPLWAAFENDANFPKDGTPAAKEKYVMEKLRIPLTSYCPLAYDVRYVYPFLTSAAYVTAENYDNSKNGARRKARSTEPGAIKTALGNVQQADVDDIVARDKGRVAFFGASSPEDVVPTAISDVNDDIRGNGFSIVYNRAAGTVTVTAEGDRELKDAAVYDASGASLVTGTSADRISDQIIVLDVRNIARGAYVVSTNLGGAKFMK